VQLYTPEGIQPASEHRAIAPDEVAGVVAEYVAAGRTAMEAGFYGGTDQGYTSYPTLDG
jgi:2,4-dienoyl-CoA reductase-like NADH-dependent reductase (Old Yellow Enzyme family)